VVVKEEEEEKEKEGVCDAEVEWTQEPGAGEDSQYSEIAAQSMGW
jgi:hypothetical protein